jgi:hypothetical protein
MIVNDVTYHDDFILKKPRRADKSPKPPSRVPTAAAAHTDNAGTVWSSPFDWLSKSYWDKGIRTPWKKALGGNGTCPMCYREEPKHVPKDCPLLKSLNLKFIQVAPMASKPAPAPAASTPAAASPSPVGCVATADLPPSGGSTGSANAPSGLTACTLDVSEDFNSDDGFRWDGDESGADNVDRKSNKSVALYPLCCSVAVSLLQHVNTSALPTASSTLLPLPPDNRVISLSRCLHQLIQQVSHSSIVVLLSERFAMADTGATDHMLPDKAAFISYKSISNLQVQMGNYSFIPVLGRGTAVISLNSQRVLICNALHVPGLVVPLYSLCVHLTQCGCAFYGAYEAGMLVCFPMFVLTVNTLSDCNLSYEPLGHCTPLDILHYVQPRCLPTHYPSEMASSIVPLSFKASHAPAPVPTLIKDDSGVSLSGIPDSFMDSPRSAHPVGGILPAMQPSNNAIDQPLHKAALDLSTISSQLLSLAKAICHLSPSTTVVNPPSHIPADAPTSVPTTEPLIKPLYLLSTLSCEAIIKLLHCEGTNLPSVCLCNTTNASDKKTHWTLEELHRAMGCRKFWNYKHILQVNRDGKWMDGGDFSSVPGLLCHDM